MPPKTDNNKDMKNSIIGRTEECERLEQYIQSEQSEFIVIFGRRRIGKTFLIRELFENRFTFRLTGMENASNDEQLRNFQMALAKYFKKEELPEDWISAFGMLERCIEAKKEGPKIIFIDELPWFDTRGAKFVSALEHFWNDWASYRKDIKLIVCGSATSWMLSKVINSRGGLHNRVTHSIRLAPFSLGETEMFFKAKGFSYGRAEILETYMSIGGVAYYLSLFERGKSAVENIDNLCFSRKGELHDEFRRIFNSLYFKADKHIDTIEALKTKRKGLTREEISAAAGITGNGNLTKILRELEECDFIRSYVPFGKSKKETLYQLIDPFCHLYLSWVKDSGNHRERQWITLQERNQTEQWFGYAFEMTCLIHLKHIIKGLGIDGTTNKPGCWYYKPTKAVLAQEDADEDLLHGTQIDLLVDRADKTVTVCEMKYSVDEYEITKDYDRVLQQRLRTFRKATKTKKSIMTVFITPNGLLHNQYSYKYPRMITADALFENMPL